jgi:hypothetical protein
MEARFKCSSAPTHARRLSESVVPPARAALTAEIRDANRGRSRPLREPFSSLAVPFFGAVGLVSLRKPNTFWTMLGKRRYAMVSASSRKAVRMAPGLSVQVGRNSWRRSVSGCATVIAGG